MSRLFIIMKIVKKLKINYSTFFLINKSNPKNIQKDDKKTTRVSYLDCKYFSMSSLLPSIT